MCFTLSVVLRKSWIAGAVADNIRTLLPAKNRMSFNYLSAPYFVHFVFQIAEYLIGDLMAAFL
jgi:hypothetical protein